MVWHWRWRKTEWVPKIVWTHDAADIRFLLEQHPADKFLQCLLLLRLGYKPKQVVDMEKVDPHMVKTYVARYKSKKLAEYGEEAKPARKQPRRVAKGPKIVAKVFKFPKITPGQGTDIFLKREYSSVKDRRPWQVMLLFYLKMVIWPRDHEVALAEIEVETGVKQADVFVILKAYLDGDLHKQWKSPGHQGHTEA